MYQCTAGGFPLSRGSISFSLIETIGGGLGMRLTDYYTNGNLFIHSFVPRAMGEGKSYLSLSLFLFTVCFYFDISVPCVVCTSIDCTHGWATRRTIIGLCSTRQMLTSHPGLPDASDRLACYECHCLRREVGHDMVGNWITWKITLVMDDHEFTLYHFLPLLMVIVYIHEQAVSLL